MQFWWAACHLAKGRVATLVTTRSSGSSYLNRVELHNGCLSLGHASTFIPSTLAGSCLDPESQKSAEPEQYAYFQTVWDIRSCHMVPGLPSQYVYMLVCCYEPQCCHPVCKTGPLPSTLTWYSGGPPVTERPLPVVDQERPWGGGGEYMPILPRYLFGSLQDWDCPDGCHR